MLRARSSVVLLSICIGTLAAGILQLMSPESPPMGYPHAMFWAGLAVLLAIIPVRHRIGIQAINPSHLLLFTVLLLYGTGTSLLAGWSVGLVATLSSPTGKRRIDTRRVLVNSSKNALGLAAAGCLLWGLTGQRGAMEVGLGMAVLLRLLGAYAAYLVVRAAAKTLAEGRSPTASLLKSWRSHLEWKDPILWITPLGAYLLALSYLGAGPLVVVMLVTLVLVRLLTVGDNLQERASWVHLMDALRMACDGHLLRHKGETQKVTELAVAIGRKMRLPSWNLAQLGKAATVHNIGYVALDPSLVLRPRQLSDAEISAIREHPERGYRILSQVAGMGHAAILVRHHHESPDGSGYPQGLKGEDIPLEAAIIKICEAFVAMSSPRAYRPKPLSRDQALDEIARAAGSGFDPTVAYYLFQLMGRDDLASQISRRFGQPDPSVIRARLTRPRALDSAQIGTSKRRAIAVAAGSAMVASSLAVAVFLSRLGMAKPAAVPESWLVIGFPGAAFFVLLLGLAVFRPARFPWGAECSWASAVVLAMILSAGPAYISISGLAFMGWALMLRARGVQARSAAAVSSYQAPYTARGGDAPVISAIRRGNGKPGCLAPIEYGLVLTIAGSCSWLIYWAGHRLATGSLGGIGSLLLPAFLSVAVFYLVETAVQSALLSREGPSTFRVWWRNYAWVFPQPLTYAVFGYAIYLAIDFLGLWVATLVFILPMLWRHKALLERVECASITHDLARAVAEAVDRRDCYPPEHSADIVYMATALAREMGKSERFVEQLEEAATLHDLGKVSWPNQVLRKLALVNEKEERYEYAHPEMSADIAKVSGSADAVIDIIRCHHEHYDGGGYVRGLKADEIPMGARILCAADSFCEMIHSKAPASRRSPRQALTEMRYWSGVQLDPVVVQTLIRVLRRAGLRDFAEPIDRQHPPASPYQHPGNETPESVTVADLGDADLPS